jgi:hypothetical protein
VIDLAATSVTELLPTEANHRASVGDQITSLSFADGLTSRMRDAEVVVFDGCAHAPLYEKVAGFTERTLAFLARQPAKVMNC